MTSSLPTLRRTDTEASPHGWRSLPGARGALAATFVAILLGTVYVTAEAAHVVASLAVLAAAMALIAAAAVAWERAVVDAESAGLIARPHR